MPVDSAAGFVEALRHGRLLEPAHLDEVVRQLQSRFTTPRSLAGELIRRGWLTPYQANQLLQGRGGDLLLGSYVLLERLGEGGMGQVFKARNWKLGHVVALKVIRKDRLASDVAVRRFRREVHSAAQVNHPNVVRALDADEVDGTHFLVMEHVEGVNLARLVQERGPLPVRVACDLVRQAALGLQHACERGLVHRDVKPSNLLLCRGVERPGSFGGVKLLDLGIARLHATGEAEGHSTMTQAGAVMGSLDYIAPEQARDAHAADARSDLYSLGCTLYFLLTGSVPFPGGGPMDKVLRHRTEEPVPVERRRPEVPPDVAAVVRRLMAKCPEDRFPTPAEAAAALAEALHRGKGVPHAAADTAPREDGAEESAQVATSARGMDETTADWSPLVPSPGTGAARPPAGWGRLWLVVAGAVALLGLLAALALVMLLRR